MMALKPPMPQAIVVFGASGDLARKKILPALYNLANDGLLPERYRIIGYASSDFDDDSFREHARASIEEFSRTPLDGTTWDEFSARTSYINGSFDDPDGMKRLGAALEDADETHGCEGCRSFYLAVPPRCSRSS